RSQRAPPAPAWLAGGTLDGLGPIIGHSAPFQQALEKARVLAAREVPVLLQGETGVGKEVFARALHAGGPRPQGPFVALNCGGLPRDLLASELFGIVLIYLFSLYEQQSCFRNGKLVFAALAA